MRAVDFQDFLKSPIGKSKDFTWSEALYLPKWEIFTTPESEFVFYAIELVAEKMQIIRDIFGAPVQITSWYRPLVYNETVGGSKKSSHILGMAVDFNVLGRDADEVRTVLLPGLGKINVRMENLEGSNWVHIDANCTEKTPIEKRYFKP